MYFMVMLLETIPEINGEYTFTSLYWRLDEVDKQKVIDLGMGDTCYPNFVTFTMYEFERHLYL